MMVLSRQTDETFFIGDQLSITVVTIEDPRVELLIEIEAPAASAETTVSLQRNQQLQLGNDISVTILDIRAGKARIGINAPKDLPVHRKEVFEVIGSKDVPGARRLFIAATADQTIRIGDKLSLQVTDVDAGGIRVLVKGELLGGADDGKRISEPREIGPGSDLLLGTQITVTLVRVAGTLAHLAVIRPRHLKIEVG